MRLLRLFRSRAARLTAFTFVEVMVAVLIIALGVAPTLAAIQGGRIHARATSMELIGQNLAVAMMELIKRSGYNEIAYGQAFPTILATATSINPLLEFPRRVGSSAGSVATSLPAAAPGGVSAATMEAFLAQWRSGTINRSSTVVSGSTNYLFFSSDQIAALNGYANNAAVPVGTTVLNPQYAWAFYVNTDAAGATGGTVGYPIKHVAVVVKWIDPRRNQVQYDIIETYVSQVGPRL